MNDEKTREKPRKSVSEVIFQWMSFIPYQPLKKTANDRHKSILERNQFFFAVLKSKICLWHSV